MKAKNYLEDPYGQIAARWYAKTGSEFYAWQSLAACLASNRPIWDEIKPYFADLATYIGVVGKQGKHAKGWQLDLAHMVIPPRQGKGSALQVFRVHSRDLNIVCAVEELKLSYEYKSKKLKVSEIYDTVADAYGVTFDKVKELWERGSENNAFLRSIEEAPISKPEVAEPKDTALSGGIEFGEDGSIDEIHEPIPSDR
jgi:hypothetical protein